MNGFVLPLDGSDHASVCRSQHACLHARPVSQITVVEVVSPHPITWTDKIVTVTGPLSLIDDGEKGMFFKIAANAVR